MNGCLHTQVMRQMVLVNKGIFRATRVPTWRVCLTNFVVVIGVLMMARDVFFKKETKA